MQSSLPSMKHDTIVPDASSKLSKKEQVADMFNNIAGKYDFLNHTLSMGIDKGWRKKAIRKLSEINPVHILDVASGTGDLAIAAARQLPDVQVMGVDIAAQMLEVGKVKIREGGLAERITMQVADSEALPFADGAYDAVMCAYGVRNFENLEKGLQEMARVTRKGGRVAILEFSQPAGFPVKHLFAFYFKYILPLLGKIVSRHSTAYTYLPESVMAFPEGKHFCEILTRCGFHDARAVPLTFGITTLYIAEK